MNSRGAGSVCVLAIATIMVLGFPLFSPGYSRTIEHTNRPQTIVDFEKLQQDNSTSNGSVTVESNANYTTCGSLYEDCIGCIVITDETEVKTVFTATLKCTAEYYICRKEMGRLNSTIPNPYETLTYVSFPAISKF